MSSTPQLQPPEHVAIIMDGNGRWAAARGLPRLEGHRQGVKRIKELLPIAKQSGVRYLTAFAFSMENWRRPAEEVLGLMQLLNFAIESFTKDLIKHKIRLETIGQIDLLPESTQRSLVEAKQKTHHFSDLTFTLALSYSSRLEVLEAVKRLFAAHQQGSLDINRLNWNTFESFLDTAGMPDPDLLIRTSGENRISNFLLMQCSYTEFIFRPEFWPDFTPEHFKECLLEYQHRHRRFGLVDGQSNSAIQPEFSHPINF